MLGNAQRIATLAHMHSASLALLSADEIRSEWTELADGRPVLVVKSHLVRSAR